MNLLTNGGRNGRRTSQKNLNVGLSAIKVWVDASVGLGSGEV